LRQSRLKPDLNKEKSSWLSVHTFQDISEVELAAIGITPTVREKFIDLDKEGKGILPQAQVIKLLEWMYKEVPDERDEIILALQSGMNSEILVVIQLHRLLSISLHVNSNLRCMYIRILMNSVLCMMIS
jgi:hypothetical protein